MSCLFEFAMFFVSILLLESERYIPVLLFKLAVLLVKVLLMEEAR